MVSFAERKLIVSRMDKQFEDGLKMRKDMNTLTHRAIGMTKGLQVLQKVSLLIIFFNAIRLSDIKLKKSKFDLTLRRPLRRKLRMRWFFDVSKVKESRFFNRTSLTPPSDFCCASFGKYRFQPFQL